MKKTVVAAGAALACAVAFAAGFLSPAPAAWETDGAEQVILAACSDASSPSSPSAACSR